MAGRTKINSKMSYPKERKKKDNSSLKIISFQPQFEALRVEREKG